VKAIAPLVLLSLALAACAAPRPAPAPAPVATKPRPIQPAPLPQPPADWRDAMQTPGTWTWGMVAGRSTATFSGTSGAAMVTLSCDRVQGRVLLARTGAAATALPLALSTTFTRRPLLSDPSFPANGWLVVPIAASDTLLDAIAFSRGRFALETAGQETLYLPSWPEISRVVEDCR